MYNAGVQNLKEYLNGIFKFFLNPIAVGLIILAVSVFFLAASLTKFSVELANVRRDMPGTLNRVDKELDRVDKQIAAMNKTMKGYENAGKDFTSGVNKGIIDIPVNTVSNVGEKLKDTAVNTGKTSYGFWNMLKDKLTFWKPATKEAQEKNQVKK
jgi:uncharacterized protein YoxC